MQKNIATIILNYNNWNDTIICVESVLRSIVSPKWIVLVDNASTDDSMQQLRDWAEGAQVCSTDSANFYQSISGILEAAGSKKITAYIMPKNITLIIVCNTKNSGYAAGNNIGLSLSLRFGADAFWIINNDTIVDESALGSMVERLFSKDRPGLCGSLIQYAGPDEIVQCRAGGKTNKWTGLSTFDGYGLNVKAAIEEDSFVVERRINFISGASVMATRDFVETVGLMDERFFLYCEEQDWSYRAKGRFDLAYASDALVLHKEGSTTGFSHRKMRFFSLWHLTRSRLLLTWVHAPYALPIVCASIIFAVGRMMWRRFFVRFFVRA